MSGGDKPVIQIQNTSSRMLRSPSHESISTEISLLSLSSFGPFARIPSPLPDPRHRLAVPYSGESSKCPDFWAEEENDLIKNFGALFKFLGLPKSFSTSDVNSTLQPEQQQQSGAGLGGGGGNGVLRKSSSELNLSQVRCNDTIFRTHFGLTSRSCSTWVAVGDISSTSQLPSPQGRSSQAHNGGSFSPADLVRSVNKKIRQLYIRKRLLVAYRALDRLNQSGFDLEKLPVLVPGSLLSQRNPITPDLSIPIPNPTQTGGGDMDSLKIPAKKKPVRENPLTLKDVERERGRPLSKFERNMMIFNWLHTLEDSSYELVE